MLTSTIIGSGPNGLSEAIVLASAGKNPTVLERNSVSDNCSFDRPHHCIELRDLGFTFAEHLHRQAVESIECADITPQMPLSEIFIIGRVGDRPSQWLPPNTGFVTQVHKKSWQAAESGE